MTAKRRKEVYDYRNIGNDAVIVGNALGLNLQETSKLFGIGTVRDNDHLKEVLARLPIEEARIVVLRLQLANGINLLLEKIGRTDPASKRAWLERETWHELNEETALEWITSGDFKRLEFVYLLLQTISC